MKKYLVIILCLISGIGMAQLPLKTLEKATAPNMFIGVDATDSLGQWKPLSGIGYSILADSSKWTVSGTNLFPKKLTFDVGIGLNNPSQQLEITENFELPMSTATTGNIFKGTDRFIHNFKHPTGQSAVPDGDNTFLGISAGNFTMGSTATIVRHGSYNVGIGRNVLVNTTTGYDNAGIGAYALGAITTGYRNLGIGTYALNGTNTGYENVGVGVSTLYSLTEGFLNTAIGRAALFNITTQDYNTAIGGYAGFNSLTQSSLFLGYSAGYQGSQITVGNGNTVIGTLSGTALGSGTNNVLLGYDVELALPNSNNQLNIGNAIYATGLATGSTPSGTAAVGIGTSAPATQLHTTGTVRFAGAGTPAPGKVLTSDADGTATWQAASSGIDSTALTAGFGIAVSEASNNWTVINTRYWNGQDTLKTTLSGLVKATSGVLTAVTDNSTNWNTAYSDRMKWDGGSTGLVAATGRTSLGGTTIGQSMFTLTNPSAITFPRFNADNTVTALSAADFRTAIGAGTYTLPSSTAGYIPYYSSTTALGSGANLAWDNGNSRLKVGGGSTSYGDFSITKSSGVASMYLFAGTGSDALIGLMVDATSDGQYSLNYNTTNGMQFYANAAYPTLPVRFMKSGGTTNAFTFYPSSGKIGLGTSAITGTSGQFIGVNASTGAAEWQTPTISSIMYFGKLHVTGASQSITAGNTTKVAYTTETDPWADITSDATNERITVNQNGHYEVDINLQGKYSGGSALLNVFVYKNGSQIWEYKLHVVSDNDDANQLNNIFSLANGDYLEVFVKANTLNYTVNQSTFIVKKLY